ncbi:NAD kinase [Litorimonas sp. WD9-15]|uniref:NAD kinase n=1 Tax=Litorimonas sp. WD9-15 TaxID=3418716 RepID=UPI003CFD8606
MGQETYRKLAFVASARPEAQTALAAVIAKYGNVDAAEADAIIPLGGDGFMLETLRRYLPLVQRGLPVYGMNQGTVGFLMNGFVIEGLHERLDQSTQTEVHPLKMTAQAAGGQVTDTAFNEVSLFRQSQQAAHIKISVDGRERLGKLIADGVMLSTPVGSTAYNLSAHGPVIPIGSDILALTPISAFRPRRWRGALLSGHAKVRFDVLDPVKRPVSASADNSDIRDVRSIEIEQDRETTLTLLFDEQHGLDEKILQEQFAT